jgi:hypothetical protein
MVTRREGPRRSDSIDAYLRGTRLVAVVALLLLAAGRWETRLGASVSSTQLPDAEATS